ncbi:hypothetical protein [Candidatus Magnetaquicoccus inordinatus]|uniref:hypothetical protein n=1 Tax=Candidatus Magnetaquicoccus inordinatus TaxID=2496818 RepID=UPI00102C99CB|nr:hypothetical protein [Candidatus Magnetaquicoccus inordinatus]
MNKISMGVAVLVSSLALSGMALAGSETAATANGRPLVSHATTDTKAAPATNKDASGRLMAAATDGKEQKAAPDAKTTEQKAGHDAKQQKPEAATAKVDAKPATNAPVAAQDSNTKK